MGTSSDEMWWRRSMLYNGCCASCILDKQVSTLRLHKETTFFQRSWELHWGMRELPPRYNQINQWQAWKLMPICFFQAYLLHVRDQFPGYSWLENDHDPWKVLKSTNKEHSVRQSADDLQIWRRLVYRYSEQSGNLGMVVWSEDSHFSFLGIKERQNTLQYCKIGHFS